MNSLEPESLPRDGHPSPVSLYCMGALLADEASRIGQCGFSRAIETALHELLGHMSRDDQYRALRLSYEITVGNAEPARSRLRLVHSRE